jgi:hypothetical protein
MGKKSQTKKRRSSGVEQPVNKPAPDAETASKTLDEATLRLIAEKNKSERAGQDDRVMAILGVDDEEALEVTVTMLNRYLNYLKENIETPCIVTGMQDFRWEEYYVIGPGSKKEYEKLKKDNPSYTDKFQIVSFYDDFDERDGIYVRVRRISDNKEFDLPLADLEATDTYSRNWQLLDDYSYWIANNQ